MECLHSETKFTTKTVGGRLKAVIALGDHCLISIAVIPSELLPARSVAPEVKRYL